MSATAVEFSELTTSNGEVTVRVQSAGTGLSTVYLHGPTGPTWDSFLDDLARERQVFAPDHPGTSVGYDQAIRAHDDLWDLVLHYDEILDQLGLDAPDVIGHSFGGMVAAELAAVFPSRVGRLVLISPLGLWDESDPVAPYQMMTREELADAMAADAGNETAGRLAELPTEEKARQDAEIQWMWSMGCASKFTWPIPERGLRKRLHRISSPTLVVWGDSDHIVPSSYVQRWDDQLAKATTSIIKGAGHVPQLEQSGETLARVAEFLSDDQR